MCPTGYVDRIDWEEIELARYLSEGIFPESGGLLDQPYRLIQIARIVSTIRLKGRQ